MQRHLNTHHSRHHTNHAHLQHSPPPLIRKTSNHLLNNSLLLTRLPQRALPSKPHVKRTNQHHTQVHHATNLPPSSPPKFHHQLARPKERPSKERIPSSTSRYPQAVTSTPSGSPRQHVPGGARDHGGYNSFLFRATPNSCFNEVCWLYAIGDRGVRGRAV